MATIAARHEVEGLGVRRVQHRAQGGAVRVDGRPLEDLPRREVALRIGVLLQEETREFWGSVRDYVLLHELMHIKQQNHSRRFWKLVESVCPAFREAERWLRTTG